MQLIDADIAGLRTAIVRLRSLSCQCNYTLIPVISVGEQNYYDELRQELQSHDVIVHDGLDDLFEQALVCDYERIAASPRIKLTTAFAALGATMDLGGKSVHIGPSVEDLAEELPRRLPWLTLLRHRMSLAWLGRFGDRMDFFNSVNAFKRHDSAAVAALRLKSMQLKLQQFHETVFDKPASAAVLVAIERISIISRYLIDRQYYDSYQTRWVRVLRWTGPDWHSAHVDLTEPDPRQTRWPGFRPSEEDVAKAYLTARFKVRNRLSTFMAGARFLLLLLTRASLGTGIAAMIYFGWLSFKTLPYRWEDMDWNNDGNVTLSEFLQVAGTDIRWVTRDKQICVEVFARRDDTVLKSHCYP